MLFLEINEFNPDLMAKAAEELGLLNLKRLLALKRSETTTDDKKSALASIHGCNGCLSIPEKRRTNMASNISAMSLNWQTNRYGRRWANRVYVVVCGVR